MKKELFAVKWIAIIILIVLGAIVLAAFFVPIDDYGYDHDYEIIIKPSREPHSEYSEFEIILPIALNDDNDPHYLMDQLEFGYEWSENEPSEIEIVNTSYGSSSSVLGTALVLSLPMPTPNSIIGTALCPLNGYL